MNKTQRMIEASEAIISVCRLIDARLDVERDGTTEDDTGCKSYILGATHEELKGRVAKLAEATKAMKELPTAISLLSEAFLEIRSMHDHYCPGNHDCPTNDLLRRIDGFVSGDEDAQESPEPDDGYACKACGHPITAAEGDDNGGYCNECASQK